MSIPASSRPTVSPIGFGSPLVSPFLSEPPPSSKRSAACLEQAARNLFAQLPDGLVVERGNSSLALGRTYSWVCENWGVQNGDNTVEQKPVAHVENASTQGTFSDGAHDEPVAWSLA